MHLIGILIIVTGLAISGWWTLYLRRKPAPAIIQCLLFILAGTTVLVSDRLVELTVEGVGTVKAAARQAVADAEAIAALKDRIVDQGATVDLVARKASEAEKLAEDRCAVAVSRGT